MATTSPGYSVTVRVACPTSTGATSELTTAVTRSGGSLTGLDVVESHHDAMVVDVTFNAQPIEKIFGLMNAVQDSKDLRTTFVSSINLTPITTGWNGTVRFGAYEKTK